MSEHTPLPWKISEQKANHDIRQIDDRLIYAKINGENLHIAETFQYQNDNNRESNGTGVANAEYIVKAGNAYPELIKMVKRANNDAHYGPDGIDWDKFFRESNDLLRKLGEL